MLTQYMPQILKLICEIKCLNKLLLGLLHNSTISKEIQQTFMV